MKTRRRLAGEGRKKRRRGGVTEVDEIRVPARGRGWEGDTRRVGVVSGEEI